jgi:biopolymer transport protein ExbD
MELWKVRHEGSPEHVEVPFAVLAQGLADGDWELTDEVQGPEDASWTLIEEHPALAELAAEIEEPPPASHDEEANIDMTALIDVCMVLLIFTILTTTVAAIQKQLEAPTAEKGKAGVRVVSKEQVAEQMIHVVAKVVDGQARITVEDREVSLDGLRAELRKYATATRSGLLLEHDDLVPQDIVVQIIDKAKGAGLSKVHMLVP